MFHFALSWGEAGTREKLFWQTRMEEENQGM